jgi:hypothetical protein
METTENGTFLQEKGAANDHDIVPFSAQQSEHWLLERTYHAHLCNGGELAVPAFTEAMKQLVDFPIAPSSQPSKSHLAEIVPLKKSTNFTAPLPTWREISAAEANALFQQGNPILLYGEHACKHPQEAMEAWKPARNMYNIIYRDERTQPEAISETESAVCYLDPKQGTFSNTTWRAWFPSDTAALLAGNPHEGTITFLAPCVQFPYTTHYTVMASDGHVYPYADRDGAIQGYQTFSPQEVGKEHDLHAIFPQFCYYHEVTCPSGIYHLEFFGPHMNEWGYAVEEATAFTSAHVADPLRAEMTR